MTLTITAKRWEHGWELYDGDECITQCATLDKADRQVRDYMCTVHDLDEYGEPIEIVPDVEVIRTPFRDMVEARTAVAEAAARADAGRRAVMQTMRDHGYSYADIAGAVGVSKGRVSQLIGR